VTHSLAISIKRLRAGATLPRYMTAEAAGMDLSAALDAPIDLAPLQRVLVPCGFAIAIPRGYEGQVRPRSGLALKHGLSVPNAPGTIDSDYRGEVCVLVVNLGEEAVRIAPGDRIAQLVISPVARAELREVENLDETERGGGGFGHTA
jgi:dUTP pyrophosphatase